MNTPVQAFVHLESFLDAVRTWSATVALCLVLPTIRTCLQSSFNPRRLSFPLILLLNLCLSALSLLLRFMSRRRQLLVRNRLESRIENGKGNLSGRALLWLFKG